MWTSGGAFFSSTGLGRSTRLFSSWQTSTNYYREHTTTQVQSQGPALYRSHNYTDIISRGIVTEEILRHLNIERQPFYRDNSPVNLILKQLFTTDGQEPRSDQRVTGLRLVKCWSFVWLSASWSMLQSTELRSKYWCLISDMLKQC